LSMTNNGERQPSRKREVVRTDWHDYSGSASIRASVSADFNVAK